MAAETATSQLSALDKLPPQQRAFVIAYVEEANGNGSKAARIANYKVPKEAAVKLRAKPAVQEAILECYRMASMSTEEVHARLATMARATIEDCLETVLIVDIDHNKQPAVYDAETGEGIPSKEITRVSLELMRETGLVHSVNEIRFNEWGPVVKLTDRQAALDKIARARGMYQGDGATTTVIIKDLRGVNVEDV